MANITALVYLSALSTHSDRVVALANSFFQTDTVMMIIPEKNGEFFEDVKFPVFVCQKIESGIKMKIDNYFVIIEAIEDMKVILSYIKAWKAKVFIVLKSNFDISSLGTMRMPWNYNVLVVTYNGNVVYNVSESSCGGNKTDIALNISWAAKEPYVIDINKTRNPGILVSLLRLLEDRLKFKAVFSEETGDIDISKASYNNSCISEPHQCSVPVYHERMLWILPKPPGIPFWVAVFYPYKMSTWSVISLILSMVMVVLWLIQSFETRSLSLKLLLDSASTVFRAAFAIPGTITQTSLKFRFLFVLFTVYAMIIDTCYLAKLFHFFSNPIPQNKIPLLDLLPLVVSEEFFSFVPKHLTATSSNLTAQQLTGLVWKRQDFITISTESALIANSSLRTQIDVLEIQFFYVNIRFKSHHPLYGRINVIMQRVTESGLYEKWVSDIKSERLRMVVEEKESGGFFKLTVTHLMGAFHDLLVGYFFGSIVFIGEVLFFHVIQRKTAIN